MTIDPTLKKALALSMKYLFRQGRSILEIREHLGSRGFDCLVVDQAVEILVQEKYLDDKLFAENYLDSREKNKPKSIFALRYELVRKGIDLSILEPLLAEYDDLELAFRAVQPKISSWNHLGTVTLKKKFFNFLGYRGFDFAVIHATWRRIFDTLSSPDDLTDDPFESP